METAKHPQDSLPTVIWMNGQHKYILASHVDKLIRLAVLEGRRCVLLDFQAVTKGSAFEYIVAEVIRAENDEIELLKEVIKRCF
jgi:hypothetical protein